jgi:hypothetical protein
MRTITVILAALALSVLSFGVSFVPAIALQVDGAVVTSTLAQPSAPLLPVRRSGVKRGDCTVYCGRWAFRRTCATCSVIRYCAEQLSYCPGRHY